MFSRNILFSCIFMLQLLTCGARDLWKRGKVFKDVYIINIINKFLEITNLRFSMHELPCITGFVKL